jgi:aminoglycoside 3-N-acetyltransferase I
MSTMQIKRLTPSDSELAISVFSMMASVFREDADTLSADYVTRLLSRNDFCALTALEDGKPIGGLIAFILPLTRSELSELFIYDIAVQQAHQRRGIGRQLVDTVRASLRRLGLRRYGFPRKMMMLRLLNSIGRSEARRLLPRSSHFAEMIHAPCEIA